MKYISIIILLIFINLKCYADNEQIEINADQLIVDQINKTATFSGNVTAIKGQLILSSDNMIAYYDEQSNQYSKQKNNIRMIKAAGNIILKDENQTASSKQASYEIHKKIIILEDHVTLKKGANILTGQKLIYDISTQKSQLYNSLNQDSPKDQRIRLIYRTNKE